MKKNFKRIVNIPMYRIDPDDEANANKYHDTRFKVGENVADEFGLF